MEKATETTLDGMAWKTVNTVDNAAIDAAAESLEALSAATEEWAAAKRKLDNITLEVNVSINYDIADMRDAAERLRREAEKRRAELEAYGEAVGKKRAEVEKIHPKLAGVIQALTPYATGEIGITDPVDTCDMILQTFVPEVTDANAKAIKDFKPVRRSPPDTAAIRKTVYTDAISRLVEAQARYETACRKLADAIKDHIDRRGKLLLEANKEQKSVEAAVALQNKRDAV